MGKYAKIALVLLYAAQLVIAFREQLVHLYKEAVEAVHRESSLVHHEPEPEVGVRLKRATTPRFNPHEILVAVPHVPAALALVFDEHGHGKEHEKHDHPVHGDEHKDKARKHRHQRPPEMLIRNLFHDIRRIAKSAASTEHGECIEWSTLYPQGAAHMS
jgi:hypothetical protein